MGNICETRVQAMCEMLSIVGKKLEENTKDKRRLEGYFVILEKWSKSKVSHLEPRPEHFCTETLAERVALLP